MIPHEWLEAYLIELRIIRTRIGWIMLVVCGPAVVAAVLVALAVIGMAMAGK